MPRETLIAILNRLGASLEGDRYRLSEERELTVFLGQPGRAVAVDHVLSLQLSDTHVEVEGRERGTFFVTYETVHALLDGRRKERRGSGGGVGF
jgi:dsDNA-specific endonuclease/ATPase MutS2